MTTYQENVHFILETVEHRNDFYKLVKALTNFKTRDTIIGELNQDITATLITPKAQEAARKLFM